MPAVPKLVSRKPAALYLASAARGVPLEIGKGRIVAQGARVALLSFGTRLSHVQKAAEALAARGITPTIADARFAKPLDREMILDLAARLVRPGGRVVFVTCSLLDAEGADQAQGFIQRHPDWQGNLPFLPLGSPRGGGWRLSPWADGTDGFFIASFSSPC